jgi:hypothetical protein
MLAYEDSMASRIVARLGVAPKQLAKELGIATEVFDEADLARVVAQVIRLPKSGAIAIFTPNVRRR